VQASCRNVDGCPVILGCSCTIYIYRMHHKYVSHSAPYAKFIFESSVLARLFLSVPNNVLCQCQNMCLCTILRAAEERDQDIPGKLQQEAESEATDAMPGKPATGMPDLAGEAVSKIPGGSSAPVKQGVEGPADTVTSSGMQGQVAESATSSNARQQSTSSVASTRPASASKPTSTIGACTCTLQGNTVFVCRIIHFCTAVLQQPPSQPCWYAC